MRSVFRLLFDFDHGVLHAPDSVTRETSLKTSGTFSREAPEITPHLKSALLQVTLMWYECCTDIFNYR